MTQNEALSYAADTESFVSGSIEEEIAALFRAHFGARRALIVADENTLAAAGLSVVRALEQSGILCDTPYVFAGGQELVPDYAFVSHLRRHIERGSHGIVAVGSGTINDLVKVAANEEDMRYLIVATAASVDGYTSPGASMIVDGFKESIYCKAPVAVLADENVIRSAPASMLSAGYADLASKITAGSDWIIADEIGVDPIDPICWSMIQDDLLDWLELPISIDKVMYGLTATGIGMQHLRRSRPASGAEHLMSHIWEMEHHTHLGGSVSHGFKVAVGTLACTALTEIVLARPFGPEQIESRMTTWPTWESRSASISKRFSSYRGIERIVDEARAKYLTPDELRGRLEYISERWIEMERRVDRRTIAYADLRDQFRKAGCPTAPEDVGLTRERVVDTFLPAGMIRKRYTILDLAWETGLLEDASEEVRASALYLR